MKLLLTFGPSKMRQLEQIHFANLTSGKNYVATMVDDCDFQQLWWSITNDVGHTIYYTDNEIRSLFIDVCKLRNDKLEILLKSK